MDLTSIELLIKPFKFLFGFLNRKPKFAISSDNKALRKSAALTIGIWVKNLSSLPHNIVSIKGEQEGVPNNFMTSIADPKYKLPMTLNPSDPEKIIVFLGQFLNGRPEDNVDCNIIIKIFSRWKGERIEAGKLKIALE